MLAKIGALGAATACCLGATYMASSVGKPTILKWRAAAKDKNASTLYADGKYANKYQMYFVGVEDEATTGANPIKNDEWWNWSYRYIYLVQKGTEGFADTKINSGTQLKEACKSAYTATKSGTDITNSSTKYKEEEIWKYCSPIGKKPTTISSRNDEGNKYKTGNIGGTSDHNTKLISVEDEGNKVFWDIRQEEFFSDSGNLSGSQGTQGKFFNKFYSDNKNTTENKPTIKGKCKEAYGKSKDTSTDTDANPTPAQVIKFCSLEGS